MAEVRCIRLVLLQVMLVWSKLKRPLLPGMPSDNPAQDDFAGVAVGISGFHLLDGRDVLVVRGIKVVQRTEHFVDGVQEAPQVLAALLGISLH